jgi:hypothetical protein
MIDVESVGQFRVSLRFNHWPIKLMIIMLDSINQVNISWKVLIGYPRILLKFFNFH